MPRKKIDGRGVVSTGATLFEEDKEDIERIVNEEDSGYAYISVSEFIREAVIEKLERMEERSWSEEDEKEE